MIVDDIIARNKMNNSGGILAQSRIGNIKMRGATSPDVPPKKGSTKRRSVFCRKTAWRDNQVALEYDDSLWACKLRFPFNSNEK
jgi:hypothetical protein